MITNLLPGIEQATPSVTIVDIATGRLSDGTASAEPPPCPPQTAPDSQIRDLTRTFKLLADETRLRIVLDLIRAGELHVRALCDRVHQSQPAVSHHLALLRMAGIVDCRRQGKHNFYRVLPQHLKVWLAAVFDELSRPA
jgi:ArsR family transcriptional regulator